MNSHAISKLVCDCHHTNAWRICGPPEVQACTLAPGPTLEEAVATTNTIVRARVIESDIARQNHILQVESYLAGTTGPEFILISYNRPVDIQGIIDTNLGGGDCNWFYDPLPMHEVGYFLLGTPSVNGAYSLGPHSYIFWASGFPLDIYDADGAFTGRQNQNEFEQYVAELRGTQPSEPFNDSRYPSTAPLLVTLENGSEYVLPVSGMDLVAVSDELLSFYNPTWIGLDYEENTCTSWECITWSGDGRTLIIDLGDDFAYVQGYRAFRFEADSFLVSPISLAVWQGNTLIIYALHDHLRYASDGAEIPREIGRVPIAVTSNNIANANHSAWSPDGRLLAFSDAEGLWLWDVFAQNASPILLRPATSDIPYAIRFSGRGRYLSIAKGDERFNFDLLSNNVLPFGYFSPDEMLILGCEGQQDMEEGRCLLSLYQTAPAAMLPGWGLEVDEDIRVQWVNDRRVLVQVCQPVEQVCGVIDSNAYDYDLRAEWPRDYNISMGAGFELYPALGFAVQDRNVAILVDSSTIEVNGGALSFNLESPIREMRWLPSLFWGENPYPPQIR